MRVIAIAVRGAGSFRPHSQSDTDCLDTPSLSASCCCVRPLRWRAARMALSGLLSMAEVWNSRFESVNYVQTTAVRYFHTLDFQGVRKNLHE